MLGEQQRSGARARAHAPRLWATSPRRGAAPAAAPRGQPARAEPGLTQGAPAEEPCGCGGAGLARVLDADQHQLQLLHLEEPPEDAAHRGRRARARGVVALARAQASREARGTREHERGAGAAASESTRAVEPCGSGGGGEPRQAWGRYLGGGGAEWAVYMLCRLERGRNDRPCSECSSARLAEAAGSPRRGRLGAGFGRQSPSHPAAAAAVAYSTVGVRSVSR